MKTILNVKTDREVKERAQRLAAHIGIPLSTVVNAYLKEFINSGEIKLTREPHLQENVATQLAQYAADAAEGKNISQTFKSGKDAAAYLNSL